MSRDLVALHREAGLARLTIDRPEVRNALSFDALGVLAERIAALAEDDSVRVVVITGSGDKAFCAGADLKERTGFTEAQTRAFLARIGDTFSALANLPQPTIAAINGVAYGGGLELALACDLRICASHARLGLTETSLAIIPGAGGTQRLPEVVGTARAKELILTARRVEAAEALSMGLVNAVCEPGDLPSVVTEWVARVAANGPLAVRAAKQAIDLASTVGGSLAERLERERALYLDRVLPSSDRLEALAAFREKRPPRFEGR